jgi:hypothetical protein
VPLTIEAGSGTVSFVIRISFAPEVVAVVGAELSSAAGAGTLDVTLETPGELSLSGGLLAPMIAAGALANITFTSTGQCSRSSPLSIRFCTLNGGAIGCIPRDGSIRVRCGGRN